METSSTGQADGLPPAGQPTLGDPPMSAGPVLAPRVRRLWIGMSCVLGGVLIAIGALAWVGFGRLGDHPSWLNPLTALGMVIVIAGLAALVDALVAARSRGFDVRRLSRALWLSHTMASLLGVIVVLALVARETDPLVRVLGSISLVVPVAFLAETAYQVSALRRLAARAHASTSGGPA